MSPLAASAILFLLAASSAEPIHVRVYDTVVVDRWNATAAFSIDPRVVEATVKGGKVYLKGMSVGTTQVSVVTGPSVETWEVIADLPPKSAYLLALEAMRQDKFTSWEGFYDSGTHRLNNSFDLQDRQGDNATRIHVLNVTQFGPLSFDQSRTSFPSAWLDLRGPAWQLTLGDALVQHSPLTLDGVWVRGVHGRLGGFEMHAGITSNLLYQDVFLPSEGEWSIGASYTFSFGRNAITPNFYAFPSESSTGGTRGVMGSVVYDFGKRNDPVRLRAELGYGHKVGAAFEIDLDTTLNKGWLRARYEPAGFASIGLGPSHGAFVDGAWTSTWTPWLVFDANGYFGNYEMPGFHALTAAGTGQFRFLLDQHWSLTAAGTWSDFDLEGPSPAVRTVTVPLGVSYESPSFGGSLIYRYERNTLNNAGGNGGRLNLRKTWGHFLLSGYADYQRNTATADLIFTQDPYLQRLFTELGLTARTPDEVSRFLQSDPQLSQLGYVQGLEINPRPWRFVGGLEAGWNSWDDSRQVLRFRVFYDQAHATQRTNGGALLSLTYSRKVVGPLDVFGALNWWTRETDLSGTVRGWSGLIGLRIKVNDVPHLPRFGGEVSGVVFRDDAGTGRFTDGAPRMAGVRVQLDGAREVLTDKDGRFVFTDAGSGDHRVSLTEPEPGTYYTTTSTLSTADNRDLVFGIAVAAARINGLVVNDADDPIPNVAVHLTGADGDSVKRTDAEGRFIFATRDGDYVLSIQLDSIPYGYERASLVPESIALSRAEPLNLTYRILANRTISGWVDSPKPGGLTLQLYNVKHPTKLLRTTNTSPDGTYAFRGLKPGRYSVVLEIYGHIASETVTISTQPIIVRNLVILAPEPDAPPPRRRSPKRRR